MTHNWSIDDREYRRHEERRGRRFAYGRCKPASTCLVVVDMVDFFVDSSEAAHGIIANVSKAAAALRAGGGVVAWAVPTTTAPTPWQIGFYGAEVAERYARSGGAGPPRHRVAKGLVTQEDDVVVEKSTATAFFPTGCDLHEILADRGITRALIAGTVTSVCCESTARDAAALGYEVVLLADATADTTDAAHNATLRTIYRSFGDVCATEDVLRQLT